MARSIAEIKKQITDVYMNHAHIQQAYGLDESKTFEQQFSATSVESILFYCVAYCVWVLERLWDLFAADTAAHIATMKPHSLRWYANKAKAYQHGFSLLPESDLYDNTGKTAGQIAASKIVKYAAVAEVQNECSRISLRVKVATDDGENPAPLRPEQLLGVCEYLKTIKDAGVPLTVESLQPDQLKMVWTVYYNPTVLNNQGSRLDGGGENVVELAIKNYLKNLPFNGTFALAYITDAVQAVPGVVIPKIDLAQYKYGLLGWQNIDTWIVPDAGYLRFDSKAGLTINYIATSEIK